MSSPEVIVARVDRGWAVLDRAAWEAVNARLELVDALEGCSSWGDYRKLQDDASDELLLCHTNLDPDEEVEDDEQSFAVDLSDVEDFDRNAVLEAATQKFIDSLPDASFLDDKTDYAETWSWVEHKHRDAVVQGLRARGYSVTVEDE